MRILRPTCSIIALVLLALAPAAPAAEPPAGSWQAGFTLPGVDGRITCACAWEGGFAVGGLFTRADSSFAFNVAAWDGSAWRALGAGLDHEVRALAVFDGSLHAAGSFTKSGAADITGLARWNGATWEPVGGGLDGMGRALAVIDGRLVVGGWFTQAGGIEAPGVAAWDGAAWSGFGAGVVGGVECIASYNGSLAIGGLFALAEAPGVPVGVAWWNGSSWRTLGEGLVKGEIGEGVVYALAAAGDALAAGGYFDHSGTVSVSNVAAWNGTTGAWEPLGTGSTVAVRSLAWHDGRLVAAGRYGEAGDGEAAAWNGRRWQPLADEPAPYPYALASLDDGLLLGGTFGSLGLVAAQRLVLLEGNSWRSVGLGPGQGCSAPVTMLTVVDGQVLAGGAFDVAGAGGGPRLAAWQDGAWTSLGGGFTSAGGHRASVEAAVVFDGRIVVGGWFDTAGGAPARNVAAWDGAGWSALGEGLDERVAALAAWRGDLYAGGAFTASGTGAAAQVARWDGQAWQPLASGPGGDVTCLAATATGLVAGGFFTSSTGAGDYVAAWTGDLWVPVGGGLPAVPYRFVVHDGRLVAAGGGDRLGRPASFVRALDAGAWVSVGDWPAAWGDVRALAVRQGLLMAGGSFTTAGGFAADRLACWTGEAWRRLAPAVPAGPVLALTGANDGVWVGGDFFAVGVTLSDNVALFEVPAASAAPPAPAGVRLMQNVPNPLNGSTSIAFELADAGLVRLRIYDAAGRLVRTLADGRRDAGRHAVAWDGRDDGGRDTASGLYFYELDVDGRRQTRKLLQVR